MAAVTVHSDFWAQENKICHCYFFLLSIFHEVMGPDAMILVFWMLSFKSAFSLSSFTFIKRFFSSLLCASLTKDIFFRRLSTFLWVCLSYFINSYEYIRGLPRWLSGKEFVCNAGDADSIPDPGRSPWRRKWQPTPVFLPGKSHEQRSLASYSPWSHKRVGHDLVTKQMGVLEHQLQQWKVELASS